MWYDTFTLFVEKIRTLGRTFRLQKEILETEVNHDEVDCKKYKDKKNEWLDYVKGYVLCTAFNDARYCKALEETIGFPMKDS